MRLLFFEQEDRCNCRGPSNHDIDPCIRAQNLITLNEHEPKTNDNEQLVLKGGKWQGSGFGGEMEETQILVDFVLE